VNAESGQNTGREHHEPRAPKGRFAKAWQRATDCWLIRWWLKDDWQYYGKSKPDPENLISAVASVLNGWIGTTMAFGAVLWGTAPGPQALLRKTADELAEEAHVLHIKIAAYVFVSIVMAGAVLGISRMLARPRKPGTPKRSRTDYATDRFSRWSFASIVVLTIFAAFAARDRVFPGQQRSEFKAVPYRFQFDGAEGVKVYYPLFFDKAAKDLDMYAVLNPELRKSWRVAGMAAYNGGIEAADKPENVDLNVNFAGETATSPPLPPDGRQPIVLRDIKANTTHTLVFRIHPRVSPADPKEAIRFLSEYANGFTVTPTVITAVTPKNH
jgi:hypothetical protein